MHPRVWLRTKATKQYYSPTGEWVAHRRDAFDFAQVDVALAHARNSGIDGLEVILETNNGDLAVPVRAPRRKPPTS